MSVTEDELKKYATGARVSMEDVLKTIKSVHYFTALEGLVGETYMRGERAGDQPESLGLLTFCVMTLQNGFTVVGQSACTDASNYNKNIGERIARDDAVKKIWPLLGYELRTKLYQDSQETDWLTRAKKEEEELRTKREKLNQFVGTRPFYELPEQDQQDLTVQLGGMKMYLEALQQRLRRATS
jgi:hypothetical protein